MSTKIFGIGFHKTGTTSLAVALKTLGYRVTGPNGVYDSNIANTVLTMAYELVEKFDAFQDNPWPVIYKQLDEKYPGSKFILTLRDAESWINSLLMDFGHQETPMRKWIYGAGCPAGNEEIYIRRFKSHNEEVLNYFKNRPHDFLLLDLSEGNGWQKLCPFLGSNLPSEPFPHVNKAIDRKMS